MLLRSHALKVESTVLMRFGIGVCGVILRIILGMIIEMIPSLYQIAPWHVSPSAQAENFQTSESEEEFYFPWK